MEEVACELAASATAGMLGKLVEFPFDTIKVRVQTNHNNLFNSTWDCIKYTYTNEGITKGFYKGVSSPVFGAILENAVLFVTYGQTYKFLNTRSKNNLSDLSKIIISGGVAGSFASFVLTPVELVKCKLQVSNLKDANSNQTVLKTIKATLQQNGIKGLWKGQSSTFIRESLGGCVWFSAYELSKKELKSMDKHKEHKQWHSLLSGALAGVMFNFSTFPVDTIKSLVQIDHHITVTQAFNSILAKNGVAGFYKGLGITLIRSAPANAVIFYTYDSITEYLNKKIN